jgi:hypothetical protein
MNAPAAYFLLLNHLYLSSMRFSASLHTNLHVNLFSIQQFPVLAEVRELHFQYPLFVGSFWTASYGMVESQARIGLS